MKQAKRDPSRHRERYVERARDRGDQTGEWDPLCFTLSKRNTETKA